MAVIRLAYFFKLRNVEEDQIKVIKDFIKKENVI